MSSAIQGKFVGEYRRFTTVLRQPTCRLFILGLIEA